MGEYGRRSVSAVCFDRFLLLTQLSASVPVLTPFRGCLGRWRGPGIRPGLVVAEILRIFYG